MPSFVGIQELQSNELLYTESIQKRLNEWRFHLRLMFYRRAQERGFNLTEDYEAEPVMEFLDSECRLLIKESRRFAAKLSPIEWIWHLRQLDANRLFNDDYGKAGFSQFLAMTLSAEDHPAPILDRQLNGSISFPFDEDKAKKAVAFASFADLLHDHRAVQNMAHRGFRFRLHKNMCFEAVDRAKLQDALDRFDRRITASRNPFPDLGTIVTMGLSEDSMKYLLLLPGFINGRREIPFLPWQKIPIELSACSGVLARYGALVLDVREIARVARSTSSMPWSNTAIHVLVFQYLATRAAQTCPYEWILFLTSGVSTLKLSDLPAFQLRYSEARDLFTELFPAHDLPISAGELLASIEGLPFSSLPFHAGPLIRRATDILVFDLLMSNYRLMAELKTDPSNEERETFTRLFENATQSLIDDSAWRPNEAREYIGRVLKDEKGDITNLDAIGERERKLLIISCKTFWKAPEYINRGFDEKRNIEQALDGYRSKLDRQIERLRNGNISNFDRSRFDEIQGVVCTPMPEWCAAHEKGETTWGLPSVCSVSELKEWLKHERNC